jgi:hypothetical protein
MTVRESSALVNLKPGERAKLCQKWRETLTNQEAGEEALP